MKFLLDNQQVFLVRWKTFSGVVLVWKKTEVPDKIEKKQQFSKSTFVIIDGVHSLVGFFVDVGLQLGAMVFWFGQPNEKTDV